MRQLIERHQFASFPFISPPFEVEEGDFRWPAPHHHPYQMLAHRSKDDDSDEALLDTLLDNWSYYMGHDDMEQNDIEQYNIWLICKSMDRIYG